jgi:Ca-activated chloride channel homolog
MTFGHPILLLTLLVPALAVVLYLLVIRRPSRNAVTFTNVDVLAGVATRATTWRTLVPPALLLLAVAVLCVAVARPHVHRLVPDERATVILVIDASRSMQATDVRPSRLVAAERAANTFLDRVPKRLRVALVVFSGDVQVAAPPTVDRELVRESIADIGSFSGFGGTAIGDAIARAVDVGQDAVQTDTRSLSSAFAAPAPRKTARGLVTIVFLSDGRQNRGILQPLEGAARAKAAGIPVFTIALGTRGGALPGFGGGGGGGGGGGFGGPGRGAPDPQTLRAIARATGGAFFAARSASSVEDAYKSLASRLGRKKGTTEVTFAFLIAAAAALVASAVASALWSPRLP